ncbi:MULTISPECIES: NRAMP family divalent metal transporter [Cytobacillus]|uniref:NRAMP family divalent metal transporter n=1 Tax=Cytobacillus TaxID=2675230 RepID=UPI001CD265CE|nr:NRAMP family divalent metal transporter [Cytobacillus kochii]MCA1026532.1 divalent metal cation transporter [Cytobacillus kochii]MCM3322317.1 divalent metal cation transporter [Cytobacillus kochii]MCM3345204.1 divalent metal cation transporter [Cytobacillus kochii]MDM5209759.1 divalent metal cation transporter [Cytobacillus kochii]
MKTQSTRSIILGAAFLMATSAIGPGFLTQTTVFTEKLAASFGFVILVSIIIDIGAQLNIWRILAVSEKKAQDIANQVLPGLGYFLALLIVMGGLAFNIGNIAGAGLGTNVLFGVSPELGALLSGLVAIGIFVVREAGKLMDRFTQVLGFVMIGLMVYVMFTASPPVGEAVTRTFVPETIDILAIVTLVGGTVGGYITFAGGHRLLDAGIKGKEALPQVTRSAVSAIGIASLMRIFLFLAALGIVSQGLTLNPDNPAASVFQHAAGNVGYKIFGVIMWAAAVTSVVGAAYTSVSFIRTFTHFIDKNAKWFTVGFIAISTLVFVMIGQPVKILVLVGSLNGLILPIALGVMLIAAHKAKIVGDYKHPLWLTLFGLLIVIVMALMGGYSLINGIPQLFE